MRIPLAPKSTIAIVVVTSTAVALTSYPARFINLGLRVVLICLPFIFYPTMVPKVNCQALTSIPMFFSFLKSNLCLLFSQMKLISPLPNSTDLEKVQTTLKQFVRDWSEEGTEERKACYEPIIAEIIGRFPPETM